MKKLYVTLCWLSVFLALLMSADRAQGQQPTTDAPPGAKGRVVDLLFRVESIGGKAESLAVKETDTDVRIDLAADVLFAFDKADILQAARATLAKAAAIVRQRAKGTVRIDGHTDSVGGDAYNQRLSERRAASVKSWFIGEGGLANVSFVTQGFGARTPVAPNKTPDGADDPRGRQKNRRVEIIIRK